MNINADCRDPRGLSVVRRIFSTLASDISHALLPLRSSHYPERSSCESRFQPFQLMTKALFIVVVLPKISLSKLGRAGAQSFPGSIPVEGVLSNCLEYPFIHWWVEVQSGVRSNQPIRRYLP